MHVALPRGWARALGTVRVSGACSMPSRVTSLTPVNSQPTLCLCCTAVSASCFFAAAPVRTWPAHPLHALQILDKSVSRSSVPPPVWDGRPQLAVLLQLHDFFIRDYDLVAMLPHGPQRRNHLGEITAGCKSVGAVSQQEQCLPKFKYQSVASPRQRGSNLVQTVHPAARWSSGWITN